jgi:CspA family cold shock protein
MSERSERVTGTVSEFDEAAGLGTITADDGTAWPFHCVEIADGTRSIDVGLRVRFRPRWKLGHVEAAAVERDDRPG